MPRPIKTPAKADIWTGRKQVVLKGTVEPLIIDGVQPTYKPSQSDGEAVPVQLFHVGRVWWLHYGFKYNTGGFKSKKDAIHWFAGGGR
jgi:hypothetical protein